MIFRFSQLSVDVVSVTAVLICVCGQGCFLAFWLFVLASISALLLEAMEDGVGLISQCVYQAWLLRGSG